MSICSMHHFHLSAFYSVTSEESVNSYYILLNKTCIKNERRRINKIPCSLSFYHAANLKLQFHIFLTLCPVFFQTFLYFISILCVHQITLTDIFHLNMWIVFFSFPVYVCVLMCTMCINNVTHICPLNLKSPKKRKRIK